MLKVVVSLFPVFVFLGALILLDSYKLVKLSSVLWTILAGLIAALASLLINEALIGWGKVDEVSYPMYVAPIIEELTKAAYVFYLIKRKKIGFMVDAAIYGFAVGAGFSFFENVEYLQTLTSPNIFLWIIRGFGTAVMHGGTTALFAIISKGLIDRHSSEKTYFFLPGLATAFVFHSFYNHFFFSPQLSTIIILLSLPTIFIVVFNQSEKATRNWLGTGFDTDMEVMELISAGNLTDSKIGKYLRSLRDRFPGEVVVDMLCLLRLQIELAMRAKGILLMREAGFKPGSDPAIKEKFEELSYLEKSIGKTGHLAIAPFLHTSSRDLWQLYMLGKK